MRCHSFRQLSHSESNLKLTKNPFNSAVLSFAPEVEEATCVGMEVDSEQKNTKKKSKATWEILETILL